MPVALVTGRVTRISFGRPVVVSTVRPVSRPRLPSVTIVAKFPRGIGTIQREWS